MLTFNRTPLLRLSVALATFVSVHTSLVLHACAQDSTPPELFAKSCLLVPTCLHLPSVTGKSVPTDAERTSAGGTITRHGVDVRINVTPDATQWLSSGNDGFTQTFRGRAIETSAGTYGDPSRFLQTVAGVVSGDDQRNDFIVRGGNPAENLFVVDNIEVPSINQLALADTTGGFVSMIDQDAVQAMTFHTDAFDQSFDQRLSSVVEISTVPHAAVQRRVTTEIGIGGMGASFERSLGPRGALFGSARLGILQYLTNDIGMNGVPHYRNALVRANKQLGDRDTIWGMSLTGIDSIFINPSILDGQETNPFTITYKGWRNTSGLNWQHTLSPHAAITTTVAHSEQHQFVDQFGQVQGSTVYHEDTTDRISSLKSDALVQLGFQWVLDIGAQEAVDQVHYVVAQPIGLQNPYSSNTAPLDATGFQNDFATASSSAYIQGTVSLPAHATLVGGGRFEQWALGGHQAVSNKIAFSIPVQRTLLHASYFESAQLPAMLYLLSFSNLRTLRPIRARELSVGGVFLGNERTRISLSAYSKWYRDYPVSTEFPQLSLANIADTFGEAFLMFPMQSRGHGRTAGIELSADHQVTSKLSLSATLAYARARYSGLDGIYRPGNFDIPFQMNLLGAWTLPHSLLLTWRYTQTSGLPYTPDNWELSYAQNRDVYNLNEVNGLRGPAYHRLDLRIEQSHRLKAGVLQWHAGLENALNNSNFYEYLWQHEIGGVLEQTQMPLFPDGGVKYTF